MHEALLNPHVETIATSLRGLVEPLLRSMEATGRSEPEAKVLVAAPTTEFSRAQLRRSAKNFCSSAADSSAITPWRTSTSWFSRGSTQRL